MDADGLDTDDLARDLYARLTEAADRLRFALARDPRQSPIETRHPNARIVRSWGRRQLP